MILAFQLSPPPPRRRFATALAAAVLLCIGSLQAADNGPRKHAEGVFDAATGSYLVVKGDDLAGIAGRFGVPVAVIKEANKLDSDLIDVGQTLAIAVSAGASADFTPQITGTLGSPSATTTISGKQLPAPQPPFGGVIKDNAINSTQWWAPRTVPPKEAPNILFIMTDDAGFGIPSTFGGVIPTPTMDRIANAGLRYNRIFST